MEDFRSPVPMTLKGAKVLTGDEAADLWNANGARAIFIDVYPQAPKPKNLPAGTYWRDPSHRTMEGAHWLPNVGYGALPDSIEAYFRAGLERLTKGDREAPIVFFCLRDCWMSWNAAKRAVAAGYTNVMWFRDGTDAWQELGYPLVDVAREPEAAQMRLAPSTPVQAALSERAAGSAAALPRTRSSALHLRPDQLRDVVDVRLDEAGDLAGDRDVLLALLEDARVPIVFLLLGRQHGVARAQLLLGRNDLVLRGELLALALDLLRAPLLPLLEHLDAVHHELAIGIDLGEHGWRTARSASCRGRPPGSVATYSLIAFSASSFVMRRLTR